VRCRALCDAQPAADEGVCQADAQACEARAGELEWLCDAAALQLRRRRTEAERAHQLQQRQAARLGELRQGASGVASGDGLRDSLRDSLRAAVVARLQLHTQHCLSLGALLQALGVPPAGWPFPTQSAVASAFRTAALRFHPDRAQNLAPQQQLYHEEAFKLIARTKQERGTY
jgi:hypothetical protein